VRVTGSKFGFAPVARYSKSTSKVAKALFTVLQVPVITVDDGSARVGKLLTVNPGSFTPSASFRYQWYRGSKAIRKATGMTYRLTSADLGKSIKVRVELRRKGYRTATVSGILAGTVSPGLTSVTPHLTDSTPRVGQVLTLTPGTSGLKWGPQPLDLMYRWFADGNPIASATQSSYTVADIDLGKTIKVEVSARASDFAPVSRLSASSARVAGLAG
jgi:hypothetical protein